MYTNSYLLADIAAEQRRQAERDAAMDRLIRKAKELQYSDGGEEGAGHLAETVSALLCLVACRPVPGKA